MASLMGCLLWLMGSVCWSPLKLALCGSWCILDFFFEMVEDMLYNTMLGDFGKWCWKAQFLGDGKSATDYD